MRLTKKTDTKEGTTIGMPKAIKAYWKLKEYEDIEEELGIDLITLYKVLDQGIYYKNMYYTGNDKLYITNGEIYNYARDKWVYLKDYGKTWALTKEELL